MVKWLPSHGFTGRVQHLDARVGGTEVTIVQEGVPEAIPPGACYLGWQESLALLALLAGLVEADDPD